VCISYNASFYALCPVFFSVMPPPARSTLFPYTTLFRSGEFVVVPRGVEHCPAADEEVHIILFEPKSTLNTGNITNERTVAQLERSEEHTSELQSRFDLVCRLLLEKKKKKQ